MQVAPLTTPNVAAAPGAAEEAGSRAEQFARVLQNAFFGAGSKAVARGAEPSAPEPARRSETRSHELRGTETRTTERSDARAANYRDSAPQTAVQKKPAQQTSHTIASKPAETPAPTTPAGQAEQAAEQPTDVAPTEAAAPETAPSDEAATPPAEDAVAETPAASAETAASDLLLILSLLQNQGQAAADADQAAATTQQQAGQNAAAPKSEMPVAPGQAPVPADMESAVPAAAAPAAPAVPAKPAEPVLPVAAVAPAAPTAPAPQAGAGMPALPEAAAAALAKATETSAAALLAQQQTVTPEEFAAIQQALMAQGQVKPASEAAIPVAGDGKPNDAKGLVVEVQPALSNAAAKTLVDQSALLAMQGEGDAAQDAALPQPLPQPQLPAQPLTADAKFAAALQAESSPQANAAAALPNNPPHIAQQASQLANPGTPAPQAVQQAASQAAARQLGSYIPAGEQVAVQIKKGAAEGLDKISIRLDPGGLGKVEVKMEVGHDGRLMAVIAADKPETLAMLQRDAQSLEQSLRDAGLKTSSDSLSFTLRDQNQAADGRDGRDGQAGQGRNRGRGHDEYAGTGTATDPAALAAANAQRAAAARGGLDIRI